MTAVDDARPEWMDDAACAQPGINIDWFFPEAGPASHREYDKARTICFRCPVRAECLDYANREVIKHGMWGGMTPKERERDRRARGYTHSHRWGVA